MKVVCPTCILAYLAQIVYAATGTLRVYDQKFVNPNPGNLQIPPDAPPGQVPSIDNGTDKKVSVYGNSECTGKPVIVIHPDRATVDFENAWGGCINIGA